MNRRILLSVLVLAAGCADNHASIEIDGRAAPSDTTSCRFAPGGQNLLGPGLLDVGSSMAPSYSMVLYVKNNLSKPTSSTTTVTGQIPMVTDASKAWSANAAQVRVNPSGFVGPYAPNPALIDFQSENTIPLDGQTVQPGGGTSTQYVEAVSGALGALLTSKVAAGELKRMVLGITLQGRTGDGAFVDTAEWYFPVDVCNGCLVAQTPTCATGEVLTKSNCFATAPSYNNQDTPPVCAAP